MYEPTTFMALMDFLPVIFFGIGALYFLRIGYRFLGQGYYTAMAGGAVLCFIGGFYKAASKLMEASIGYCIVALEASQYVFLAPGFLLLFISALALIKYKPVKGLPAAAPAFEMWKIPFLALMTLANLGFLIAMAVFALKRKLRLPAVLYILSVLAMILMSYLATQPFTTSMHWLAQSINSIVQLLAMAGHIILYQGVLKDEKSYKPAVTA